RAVVVRRALGVAAAGRVAGGRPADIRRARFGLNAGAVSACAGAVGSQRIGASGAARASTSGRRGQEGLGWAVVSAGARLGDVTHAGSWSTHAPYRYLSIRRATIASSTAVLSDIAHTGRHAAHEARGLLGVGGASVGSAVAGLCHVADPACRATAGA